MKKHNHIRDLEKEKLRLRVQQLELEKQIRLDWNDLKKSLSPKTFIANKLNEAAQSKPEGSLLSGLINYGMSYLGQKFSEKAGRGLESVIKKGIDKLSGKLNSGI